MLKPCHYGRRLQTHRQPPSGGCVLKLGHCHQGRIIGRPAAFRRLCVETSSLKLQTEADFQPPSGGCVLKPEEQGVPAVPSTSRLQAAVC